MKRILYFLILIITSQSFAASVKNEKYSVTLDLVSWKLREGGADNWGQIIASPGTLRPVKILDVPFGWSTGFKLGAGYTAQDDLWTSNILYTHYQTTESSSATGSVYSQFLGNFYAGNTDGSSFGPYYDSANIRWKFWYNTLDLTLGHAFNIDSGLIVKPFIGLKGASIDQTFTSNWAGPHSAPTVTPPTVYNFTTATETLENNFWGIGPSIGVNTIWPFYKKPNQQFSFVGDFLGALMWGNWSFKDRYVNNAPSSTTINSRNFYTVATMMSGLLGLGWERESANTDISVKLGYEAQVWFNQIQYYSLNMGRTNNLMSLQGATLDCTIKFLRT